VSHSSRFLRPTDANGSGVGGGPREGASGTGIEGRAYGGSTRVRDRSRSRAGASIAVWGDRYPVLEHPTADQPEVRCHYSGPQTASVVTAVGMVDTAGVSKGIGVMS